MRELLLLGNKIIDTYSNRASEEESYLRGNMAHSTTDHRPCHGITSHSTLPKNRLPPSVDGTVPPFLLGKRSPRPPRPSCIRGRDRFAPRATNRRREHTTRNRAKCTTIASSIRRAPPPHPSNISRPRPRNAFSAITTVDPRPGERCYSAVVSFCLRFYKTKKLFD